MGQGQSNYEATKEKPVPGTVATLYYFSGRGKADQIRWLLAATEVSFTQKVVDSRQKFLKMAARQLPFGQLPLLQIDGLEIVQSQAIVRYVARRAGIAGTTTADEVKCEMIVDTVNDLLPFVTSLPFKRSKKEELKDAVAKAKERWMIMGTRLEFILKENGGKFLVGGALTYADVLVAHALTWYVEECGSEIVVAMPLLVNLQNKIIHLPGVQAFIKSQAYYPISDQNYVNQVGLVLDRKF